MKTLGEDVDLDYKKWDSFPNVYNPNERCIQRVGIRIWTFQDACSDSRDVCTYSGRSNALRAPDDFFSNVLSMVPALLLLPVLVKTLKSTCYEVDTLLDHR